MPTADTAIDTTADTTAEPPTTPLQIVPARMINEWVYCPRLAILEHVHGEWADNAATIDGKRVHRRVDQSQGAWPQPEDLVGREVARALWLTAEVEGITAKLDLVEAVDNTTSATDPQQPSQWVRPVDYKRGKAPDTPAGAWLPERVQVCAQALVLREQGYNCDEAALWFDGSRRRVAVPIDDDLIAITRKAAAELRKAVAEKCLPAPLVDSAKCNGCSLAGICLPDEIGLITGQSGDAEAELEERLHRRLIPARDDGTPLHVVTQGARLGISGEELVVKKGREKLGSVSFPLTSRVAIHGRIQVSTQALTKLMRAGKPVAFFSMGGWFHGLIAGMPHGNVFLRQAQHAAANDPDIALTIARRVVMSKLRNQRTLLRRNRRVGDENTRTKALRALKNAVTGAATAENLDSLMGYEGSGARAYFAGFDDMLNDRARELGFQFTTRNRRPATDPVNAALSFAYALLTRACNETALIVGLEPLLGFLHQPRHNRPALALDLMEEFRPIIADSAVLRAFNNGELKPSDFVQRGGACSLDASGRKKLIAAYERRMDELVTHPVFGYRVSYRRVLEVQTRLLARHLLGELEQWPGFEVR